MRVDHQAPEIDISGQSCSVVNMSISVENNIKPVRSLGGSLAAIRVGQPEITLSATIDDPDAIELIQDAISSGGAISVNTGHGRYTGFICSAQTNWDTDQGVLLSFEAKVTEDRRSILETEAEELAKEIGLA